MTNPAASAEATAARKNAGRFRVLVHPEIFVDEIARSISIFFIHQELQRLAGIVVGYTDGWVISWELNLMGRKSTRTNEDPEIAIPTVVRALELQFDIDSKQSLLHVTYHPRRDGRYPIALYSVPADDVWLVVQRWTWDLVRGEGLSGKSLHLSTRPDQDLREFRKRWPGEATISLKDLKPQRPAPRAPEPPPPATPPTKALPTPQVSFQIDFPRLQFQESLLPESNLSSFLLREKAALWWVSNQSDDLLCLSYCRIEKLDYQVRTALRAIGPLRGRALLSDEVGLGKTIEAGLILKEYLTRGMVKNFLVLTVPSLVDQWEEELSEKFQINAVTTNQSVFKSEGADFWRQHHGIIASLHTVKQASHLASAQQVKWDLLIIDEAHYLRNRTSQAWQAVNALPRQFLLLLSATPVQNSLEELYHLVTLLQPGQLPSPKEFRDRYMDKKNVHKPKEPEELRRLLSQVMIRNTRANAGVNLPPRRAETVLFQPSERDLDFWKSWEMELRQILAGLSPSLASLWGRLLLQTAGSSPAAWRSALSSFPDQAAGARWASHDALGASWQRKTDLLVPLTKSEGGVVIFTQFIDTQTAVAAALAQERVPVFFINGQTPAAQRHGITEQFRRESGALILTHSGTEGRNLQFCHKLVNFDLPWNPMEIEQRIGRLHRLGQQHPVRIYNFVQQDSLQEHLLNILQEKLNLFELVVGETGLILGDRFSSDEFAEEVFRRWRDAPEGVAQAMETLGTELAAARAGYDQVKALDETLFAKDYESL